MPGPTCRHTRAAPALALLSLGLALSDWTGCSRGAPAGQDTDGPLHDAGPDGTSGGPPDESVGPAGDGPGVRDLARGPDLARAGDLHAFADLRLPSDLRFLPDLRAPDLATPPDLTPGVLTVNILARDDCTFSVSPASYGVPIGTTFKVNWLNLAASGAPVDIDKGGDVPIVLDLGPGMNYDDTVHPWCGIFTGTFVFHIKSCGGLGVYDLQVNCNA